MNKWYVLFLVTVLMLFSTTVSSKATDKTSIDLPQVEYFHYKDDISDDKIVIEKFLYNETTGVPYTFDAIVDKDGIYLEVSDQVKCIVSDDNIIKPTENNGIYAVKGGHAQVTLVYQGLQKTYNIEVVDSVPLQYRLDKDSIILDSKGKTKLVQEFADMPDGTSIRINHAVKWETMNPEIATISDEGLICAESKGKTSIIADFGGIKIVVPVEVLDSNYNREAQEFLDKINMEFSTIDEEALSGKPSSSNDTIITPSISDAERSNIISRCSLIFNTSWKPTKNLAGWKGKYTYKAGTTYTGLSYTQINHTDKDGTIIAGLTGYYSKGFLYALNNPNTTKFYTKYVSADGVSMPRYGTDCSGYVSAAFKINRLSTAGLKSGIGDKFSKVGSYNVNNPTKANLLASYPKMQRGDALVYRVNNKGHTFIVGNNYVTSCLCYEQTTYWTKLLWHDYEDLANTKYLPFSKK